VQNASALGNLGNVSHWGFRPRVTAPNENFWRRHRNVSNMTIQDIRLFVQTAI